MESCFTDNVAAEVIDWANFVKPSRTDVWDVLGPLGNKISLLTTGIAVFGVEFTDRVGLLVALWVGGAIASDVGRDNVALSGR